MKKAATIIISIFAVAFFIHSFFALQGTEIPQARAAVDCSKSFDGARCESDQNDNTLDVCFHDNCIHVPLNPGTGTTTPVTPGIDLDIYGVINIIRGWACTFTRIALPVIIIFLVLSGFRFMTSGGAFITKDGASSGAYVNAKKNFKYVLIGAVIIIGVYVLIASIADFVGVYDFNISGFLSCGPQGSLNATFPSIPVVPSPSITP